MLPCLAFWYQSHVLITDYLWRAGLYVVNVKQRSPVQTVAVNQSHESPSLSLAWNTGSSGQKYLYANNGASISAYRASELE